MNALAHDIRVAPRWRLGIWAARAWKRMTWRHVLLAPLIEVLQGVITPLGGSFLMLGWDPVPNLIRGDWAFDYLPVVYGVLIADEAFADGVRPWRAYGLAVVALTLVSASALLLFTVLFVPAGPMQQKAGETLGLFSWLASIRLYLLGFCLSIYAYWRVTQRTMRQAQAAETERVRNEQRIHAARLLALQSRVEPQMLFDTLARIADLLPGDTQAADTLLADLIVLLRAMLPGTRAEDSTVGHEFALVDAWLRVTSDASRCSAQVHLRIAPEAEAAGVAPMLILPLVQAVLAQPLAMGHEWSLAAQLADDRLLVTLQASPDTSAHSGDPLARADLSSLHERLGQLYGRSALLSMSESPPKLTLDMPCPREQIDGTMLTWEGPPVSGAADLQAQAT